MQSITNVPNSARVRPSCAKRSECAFIRSSSSAPPDAFGVDPPSGRDAYFASVTEMR